MSVARDFYVTDTGDSRRNCRCQVRSGPDPDGGLGGCNLLFSNRRGSIISYNFIRKEKISTAINICYQVNSLFQKFLYSALGSIHLFPTNGAVEMALNGINNPINWIFETGHMWMSSSIHLFLATAATASQ